MAPLKKALLASCAAGLAALARQSAFADTDIFQCTDASGRIEYKNTGETKGCKKIVVEPVVVPGAKVANNTPRNTPNFPIVDAATQKSRDTDRRKILEDELNTQRTKMAQLQKDYNNGEPERTGDERNYQRYLDKVQQMKDTISRTQSDIDSIQGEIGKLPQ
jgi:hypothetical protein